MQHTCNAIWRPFTLITLITLVSGAAAQDPVVLDDQIRHLGDSVVREWPGVPAEPEGPSLRREFSSTPNTASVTLEVGQRDVEAGWTVSINGRSAGQLRRHRPAKVMYYEVPANALVAGTNVLEFTSDNPTDDIAVGPIRLHSRSLTDLLELGTVRVRVTDAGSGTELPARLSVQSLAGEPAEVYQADAGRTAIREGLVYVRGDATFALRRGEYRIAATRGMEWSRDVREVEIKMGQDDVEVALTLRREVDTAGYIAADTHLHTYEFSGHGDATAAERVLSLAGEGVELAVATDHNHQLDYRPYQSAQQLEEYFTPVVGNEVTTPLGHFNGFPLPAGGDVPPYNETDWVKLVEGIRLKGAKVVILNHPRWPDIARSPLTKHGLNRASGERSSGGAYTFDAMELVNSTVDTSDPLYLFVDWFALLNRGETIRAVGTSDTHTVGDPAGQGRTYIRSGSDDPARLDVDELCGNLVAGRASVSLGIFADAAVNGTHGMGDLVPVEEGSIALRLRVAAPGWIQPRRALVYLNSVLVAEREVPASGGAPTDATLEIPVKTDGIDAHLVCVVLGDGVAAPGWETLNDYTLAATNPVFLDVNGDGAYSPPRESALRVYQSLGDDFQALVFTLDVVPPFLGVQLVTVASERLTEARKNELEGTLRRLAEQHPEYALYLRHRPAVSGRP